MIISKEKNTLVLSLQKKRTAYINKDIKQKALNTTYKMKGNE